MIGIEVVMYTIIGLGVAYAVGAIGSVIFEKWWLAFGNIAGDKRNVAQVKQLTESKKKLDEKNRSADKSRDIRIDELLAANKTVEAKRLIEEKLRSAHEHGNETLSQLYRNYLVELETPHDSES